MIELRKETNAQFKLKVGRSKTGFGLYAMEPIPKGKKIIEYVGRVLTNEPDDATNGLYIFNINKHLDVDGAPRFNTARYINHSCRPNAESDTIKDHIWIKARRNIMLGEELTYDYGKEYFDEYIKPKGCRCAKHLSVAKSPKNPKNVSKTKAGKSKGIVKNDLANPRVDKKSRIPKSAKKQTE